MSDEQTPTVSPEREYVVVRDVNIEGHKHATLEIVGRVTAATPKQARIAAAKTGRIIRADLERGVELRAIPATAFDSGAGEVKLEVREEFLS